MPATPRGELFHGKQPLALVDAAGFAAGMEKLILAEIYAEDGDRHTGIERLRQGIDRLKRAAFRHQEAESLASLDPATLLEMLRGYVRSVVEIRAELERRGVHIAIDQKRGEVMLFDDAARPAAAAAKGGAT